MQLYLPEVWTSDRERCRQAGWSNPIPDEIDYAPKWQIALDLIDKALSWGVQQPVTLADSGYGDTMEFRAGLSERGLIYNVAVKGTTVVWPPGATFEISRKRSGRGRRPSILRSTNSKPTSIAALAKGVGRSAYRKVTWRQGTRGKMSSTFVSLRVRTAHGHTKGKAPGEEQWLVCEWPKDKDAPTKFYLSTQPASCSLKQLVRTAHLRWRVERDYQDLKQEVGLDHFEGRTWRGFHHHAALCAAAHAFLALRRVLFPL